LGGLLVYRWARDLHGPGAGLAALALYVFCPSIVAHSHLATVDVGAATLTVAALYTFDRWLRRPGPGALALCGVALGLAQLAKFTALLLYPILVLLALLAPRPEGAVDWAPARSAGRRAAGLATIFLLSLLVVEAGYLFQGVGTPLTDLHLESRGLSRLAAALPPSFPSPLPAPYLMGLDGLQLINDQGEFPGYLFGRWSREGWKGYYLVALLFKTPLPFLLACLAAPFAAVRDRRSPAAERSVWLPLLFLLLVFSLLSRVDYGIRYVLPVLPLAAVYASRLVPWATAAAGRRGRLLRGAGIALLAVYPLSVLLATPDTIDYFNLLARGRGDRILLDSNLDWGQGLKRVRAAMDRAGVPEIALAYFGHVDPAIYGIGWHFPDPHRGELVAVSANFLHGYPYVTYAGGRMVPVPAGAFAWIAGHRRVADLGGGIYLYRTGASPPGPATRGPSTP